MFLVFEGLDGSGKSTLMKNLMGLLESQYSRSVYMTREPGGTPLGEEIRKVLLEVKADQNYKISARAELLLYEASRAQHVEQVIRPHLKKDGVVLCDRFTASSVAFQAGGRELSEENVESLNQFAVSDCTPDLQVLVDLDFEGCRERKKKLNEPLDRIESEAKDFHQRVYESYKAQAKNNPEAWLVLEGRKTPEQLLEDLVSALKTKGYLK